MRLQLQLIENEKGREIEKENGKEKENYPISEVQLSFILLDHP